MGRMTDNDANALRQIRKGTRARILYLYLVQGYNMKDIAEIVLDNYDDFASQTVSVVTRSYGFHQGSGRGRYGDIPESVVKNFVRDYAPENSYDGLNEGTFDRYISDYRRQQQANRQQAERQRQQQAAWERQAAQRERERQAAQQEQARQAAQREKDLQNQYNRYLEEGKRKLAAGNLQEAYTAFLNARNCIDTWELTPLIAEVQARAGNAKELAEDIIRELTAYLKHTGDLTWQQYYWLAEAYLARGDMNRACNNYFNAGDKFYDQENYKRADKLYTEGRNKTNLYAYGHAFNVAYARSKSKPEKELTEDDHRLCINYYEIYRDKGGGAGDDSTYVNLGYHHNLLGEYRETVRLLSPRAQLGSDHKNLFKNLANACYSLEMWAEAVKWYREAARKGEETFHYRIGRALALQGDYAGALPELRSYAQEKGAKAYEVYEWLAAYANKNGDFRKKSEFNLKHLELQDEFDRDLGEVWLNEAERHGFTDISKQMLALLPKVREQREAEKKRLEAEAEKKRLEAEAEKKRLEAEAEKKRLEEEAEKKRLEAEAEKKRLEEEALLLLMM